MKKTIFIMLCAFAFTAIHAQKWSDLTQEEKVMKAKEFRADNQKYLKGLHSLKNLMFIVWA